MSGSGLLLGDSQSSSRKHLEASLRIGGGGRILHALDRLQCTLVGLMIAWIELTHSHSAMRT
jgi:hypothetical protein